MIDEDFRFDRNQWRGVVRCLPIPVPADADVRVILDSSPTANEMSDRSALVAGFINPYRELDGQNELVVLDYETNRWKGLALVDAVIDFVARVSPQPRSLRIEHIPGTELLKDTILLRAESRGVVLPPIVWINPASKVKGAKSIRIMALQHVVSFRPPKILIQWRSNIEDLLDEVEDFVPSEQNRGRQINLLDAIALLGSGK